MHMATNERISHYPARARLKEERHTHTATDKQLQLPEWNSHYPTGARLEEKERPTAINERICRYPVGARLEVERHTHMATNK